MDCRGAACCLAIKPMATTIGTGGAVSTGVGRMKVVELKAELQKLGLDTEGLKEVLVRRLTEARTAGEGAEQEPQ